MPRPPITGIGSPNLGCLEAVYDEPAWHAMSPRSENIIQTCRPATLAWREKCNNWKLLIYQQKYYCQISPVIQSGRIDHSELELANNNI